MQIHELLEELGFGQNEAEVYVAVIEMGQSKAGALIKRTGLHRHIVYESLKSLEAKHLVSSTKKNNILLFQATNPKRLLEQYESKRKVLVEVVKELQTKHVATKPEIVVYEGLEGPKTLLSEMLDAGRRGEQVYGMNANEDLCLQTIPNELHLYFEEEKKMDPPMKERLLFREGFESPNPVAEIRHLPPQFFTPLGINIYGDKVALTDYADPITTMIIQKETFAQGFKEYFNILWEQDVKTYRGAEGLRAIMEESLKHNENWFIGGNAGIGNVMMNYWQDYNKRRIEQGVWWHDLVDQGKYLPGIQKLPPGKKDHQRFYEFKWLPKAVSSPTVIFMYGCTVAQINWDALYGFTIEDEAVFDNYRKYFDYLWNQDVTITRGLQNAQE